MGTSPSRGRHSCSAPGRLAAATLKFRELAQATPLQKITKSLGSDAQVYLVGGCVRDTLLGKPVTDLDLACSLEAEESARRLNSHGVRTVETGLRHGTIMALCDGQSVEITAFRTATGQTGKATIETDLLARDFTINAIALPCMGGELLDPSGGLTDLQNNLLRALPSATDRFTEDPLRILRLVRFGPADGRRLDPETDQAARQHSALLDKVAPERIRVELEKILVSEHPADALRYMLSAGLLPFTVPELIDTVGFEQNRYHIHDVFEHTLSVIERAAPELRLRLVALFHDLGKPASLSVAEDGERHFYLHEKISEEICKRRMRALRFSSSEVDSVCNVVSLHMRPADCGPSGLRRLMRDLGSDFQTWRSFKLADASPAIPEEETLQTLQTFDEMVMAEEARVEKLQTGNALALGGDDLIELGIAPGPRLGAILKNLRELILDSPELNERETLLARARQIIKSQTS